MRKLYPTDQDNKRNLNAVDNWHFTEEQYNALIRAIEQVDLKADATDSELDTYKHNLEQSITSVTGTFDNLNADVAALGRIVSDTVNATDINVTNRIEALRGLITNLESNIATISTLQASNATIGTASIDTLTGDNITITGTLKAHDVDIDTFSPSAIDTDDLTATNATINNETVAESTIGTANITEANVGNADVDTLTGDKATIPEADLEHINTHYITHNKLYNNQTISSSSVSADGDFWIVLPKFSNGTYNLIATDTVEDESSESNIKWSMEIMNSTQNIAFRWSVSDSFAYLVDVDLIKDIETGLEFIQIHGNTNGEAIYLHSYCNSYDTTTTPTIYAYKVYEATDPLKHFDFKRKAGTWLPNSVFAGEFHADSMIIDETVFEKITLNHDLNLPIGYDQYGSPINYTKGTPGQYVTPTLDEYDHTGIQWKEPVDNTVPSSLSDSIDLVTERSVSNYNGIKEGNIAFTDAYTSDNITFYDVSFTSEDEPEGTITATTSVGDFISYNGSWYKKADSDYFEVSSFTDDGTIVEDTSLIAQLDLETPLSFTKKVYRTSSIAYNIKHLGSGTKTHGDHEVERDLTVDRHFTSTEGNVTLHNFYNGTEDDFDPTVMGNNSIVIFTEVNDQSDYVAGKIYRYRIGENLETVLEEIIASTDKDDQKPVIYDQRTNSYKTVNEIELGEIVVDELHAQKAFIKELDTVKEETISSTGDYVVLRANNPAAMTPSDHSGVLVHNVDGHGTDSAVVSDSNGFIRVGKGIPTNTTYPVLYWDKTTEKYYTDIEDPATEVEPEGALTSWTEKDDTTDYVKYLNAVFSVINFERTVTTDYLKIGSAYFDEYITSATPQGTETVGAIVSAVDGITDYDNFTTGCVKSYNDDVYVLLTISNENKTVVKVTGLDTTDVTPKLVGTVTVDDDLYGEIYDNGTTLLDTGPFNLGNISTFTVTESSLEPLMTRAENVDMNNQGLVKWNSSGKKADTIATPTASEQTLTSEINNGKIEYKWTDKQSGSYVFNSKADYESYVATHNIPDNSQVIIKNENSNVYGEEM